jgi:endonuclease/exonuclease/phosphatase family metal-dependent hydrolase
MVMKKIRLISYNIHKGFSLMNRHFVLKNIKDLIHLEQPDLICLQEVLGHPKNILQSQFEYLADQSWPHYAYGKNAVYAKGNHGNAILSKFPITSWANQNISVNKLEMRGLLYSVLNIPETNNPIYVFCVHLGLLEKDRLKQIQIIGNTIESIVPENAPLLIAGDFNDWRKSASGFLQTRLKLKEAFLELENKHPLTYPSWFPLLALDRIYYRNLECISVRLLKNKSWSNLSDHLPIEAEFQY